MDEQIDRLNHRHLGVIRLLLQQGGKARIVDFSHFHLEYPHEILLPIWLSAKLLFGFYWYKYILDGSLPSRYQNFTALQRSLFRRAIDAIDEFIVVSDELARWLKETIKVTQRITVIPCLLNIPEAIVARTLSAETEKQLQQFLKHQRKVCTIGTFISDYGFAPVANAIERLRAEDGEDIGLLLLEGAFATDDEYRRQVLADRPWITVLKNVPNPEVYQILRRCDLFARTVGLEGYGISRIEAIWCGVPVVATSVGETRGMLTYEFGDERKLAELIRMVLLNGVSDLTSTGELFRSEADQNLQKFVETTSLRESSQQNIR